MAYKTVNGKLVKNAKQSLVVDSAVLAWYKKVTQAIRETSGWTNGYDASEEAAVITDMIARRQKTEGDAKSFNKLLTDIVQYRYDAEVMMTDKFKLDADQLRNDKLAPDYVAHEFGMMDLVIGALMMADATFVNMNQFNKEAAE